MRVGADLEVGILRNETEEVKSMSSYTKSVGGAPLPKALVQRNIRAVLDSSKACSSIVPPRAIRKDPELSEGISVTRAPY